MNPIKQQAIINGSFMDLFYEIVKELLNEGVENETLKTFLNEYEEKRLKKGEK